MIAFIVDKAGAREATFDEAVAANGTAHFIWFHLNGRDPASLAWLDAREEIPEIARKALVALETRPRTDAMGAGALVNLRGLSGAPDNDPDALVSIRLWAEKGRVVSASLRDPLALAPLCDAVRARKVCDPGDLISILATAITDELDPDVAALGDQLDDCETMLDVEKIYALRRGVAKARTQAIQYRRFVAPQRLALERLAALDAGWLEEADRLHLREAADRCARMTEELEAIRERSALMHEQLTDLRAEQLDTRSLVIAVAALVFLPLTFLTGLFGMNVPLPLADSVKSFWGVLIASGVLTAAIVAYFLTSWYRR